MRKHCYTEKKNIFIEMGIVVTRNHFIENNRIFYFLAEEINFFLTLAYFLKTSFLVLEKKTFLDANS